MHNFLTGVKKNWLLIAVVAAVFIWFFSPYYRVGLPTTHDSGNHVARFASYYLALKEGQIPPRIGSNLLNGFSYPVFHYNYPLLNIFSLPFSVMDVHFETSFKILTMLGVALGMVGTYFWLGPIVEKSEQNSRWRGLVLLALLLSAFLLNPYLVSAIWFRGNIGEVWALAILLWLFTALDRKKTNWLIFGTMFLILAHNVLAMLGIGVLLVWAIFNRQFLWTLKQVLLGVFLSAWFWLPAIAEKSLVVLDGANLSRDFVKHFVSFGQLLSFNLSWGFSHRGNVDGLGLGMGLVFWLSFILMALALVSRQLKKNWRLAALCLLIVLLLWLQTQSSVGLWRCLPLLNFVQFPWRLAAVAQILGLFLLAHTLVEFKATKWLVAAALLMTVIINWPLDLAENFHWSREYWLTYPGTTSTLDENLPRNFSYEYFNFNERVDGQRIIFVSDDGLTFNEVAAVVNVHQWTGRVHRYDLKIAQQPTVNEASFSGGVPVGMIVESTAYFPGWETRVNGQRVQYYLDDTEGEMTRMIGGRVAFILPTTTEVISVETKFTGYTALRLVSGLLGLSTLVYLGGRWKVKSKRASKLR